MAKKNRLYIDGVAGSQLRDTQGETLDVDGADISILESGEGRWNDNHGKGFFNSIGRIEGAKKIYKAEDCDNPRQEYYWSKIKAPFIYAHGYLYNDEEHPNAKAAAAILKTIHKEDAPLKLKASVEGGVISRGIADPSHLAQTKIHSVALTFTPANNATLIEPTVLSKTAVTPEEESLIKSLIPMAMNDIPSFIDVSERMALEKIYQRVNKIRDLAAKELELQKGMNGLKNLAVGVAMMQGAHYIGQSGQEPKTASRQPAAEVSRDVTGSAKSSSVSPYNMKPHEFVDHIKDAHPHLHALAHNESSGGHNLDHKEMKNGMHKGHKAGGPWGMMPNTAKFVIENLDKKGEISNVYPYMKDYAKDIGKHHGDISEVLNASPMLSFHLASKLYNHLHDSHEGHPEKIAHSWFNGLNGTKKAMKSKGEGHILSHPYVEKFNSHIKKYSKKNKKMKKALTAGYGGAGAPTDMTGGSVMQSESVGESKSFGGPKKGQLQYITCDKCGEEQVHAANQVKCRGCNSSFSLEKLYRAIVQ